MKKTLLATTLLVATASFASAEVTLSGSGRFGLIYSELLGALGAEDTYIHTRMRVNIDAKMETDSGLTFGGRIRMQSVTGDPLYTGVNSVAGLNAAMLYMEANGLRVEVGNANGAYDSAGLLWNSEVGLIDWSYGDPAGSFASYSSGGGGGTAVGIFASYSMGDLTARISHHTNDQLAPGAGDWNETSVSVDWSSNGFSVSAAATSRDIVGFPSYGLAFIGAAYAIGDSTNVGLNYYGGDINDIVTLYGNHTMASGLTVAGYITDIEGASDTGLGIGASYPLGEGASLKGSYHTFGSVSDFADFGVTFSF